MDQNNNESDIKSEYGAAHNEKKVGIVYKVYCILYTYWVVPLPL